MDWFAEHWLELGGMIGTVLATILGIMEMRRRHSLQLAAKVKEDENDLLERQGKEHEEKLANEIRHREHEKQFALMHSEMASVKDEVRALRTTYASNSQETNRLLRRVIDKLPGAIRGDDDDDDSGFQRPIL